jgi:hypothetical protein
VLTIGPMRSGPWGPIPVPRLPPAIAHIVSATAASVLEEPCPGELPELSADTTAVTVGGRLDLDRCPTAKLTPWRPYWDASPNGYADPSRWISQ